MENGEFRISPSIINYPFSIIHLLTKCSDANSSTLIAQGLLGSTILPKLSFANYTVDKRRLQFVFAQVKYRGGDWNPHPLSVTPLDGRTDAAHQRRGGDRAP